MRSVGGERRHLPARAPMGRLYTDESECDPEKPVEPEIEGVGVEEMAGHLLRTGALTQSAGADLNITSHRVRKIRERLTAAGIVAKDPSRDNSTLLIAEYADKDKLAEALRSV